MCSPIPTCPWGGFVRAPLRRQEYTNNLLRFPIGLWCRFIGSDIKSIEPSCPHFLPTWQTLNASNRTFLLIIAEVGLLVLLCAFFYWGASINKHHQRPFSDVHSHIFSCACVSITRKFWNTFKVGVIENGDRLKLLSTIATSLSALYSTHYPMFEALFLQDVRVYCLIWAQYSFVLDNKTVVELQRFYSFKMWSCDNAVPKQYLLFKWPKRRKSFFLEGGKCSSSTGVCCRHNFVDCRSVQLLQQL